jgi:hypothetical protein
MKRVGYVTFVLLVGCALGLGTVGGPAAAQTFPNTPGVDCPDDDVVSSLGAFIIWVEEDYRPALAGVPGWEVSLPDHWTSPPMLDPTTTIGRSCVHTDGDASDSGGTAVGTAGTMVKDSDFAFVPTAGYTDGPPGTREVHTEIRKLNLEEPGCGFALRVGTDSGVSRPSFGEVEDNNPDPALDFPAESFFNVFFEVDLPLFGGTTLYNKASDPLVVVNDALDDLPPTVVYIHGETPAVPIYFKGGPENGKRFGFLRLAGHGSNFFCQFEPVGNCPEDGLGRCKKSQELMAALAKAVDEGRLMDCPDCKDEPPTTETPPEEYPCWIWIILVIILVVIVIILIIIIIRRR